MIPEGHNRGQRGSGGAGGGGGHYNHNNSNTPRSNSSPRGGGSSTGGNTSTTGGLKPLVKAYGIVGFIRFLDCYYLTLITRRSKVGSIGGNGIYTIKNTETIPLKPAEIRKDSLYYSGSSPTGGGGVGGYTGLVSGSASSVVGSAFEDLHQGTDPSSVLLSMWNRGKRSVGLGLTNREIAELRYQGLYQVNNGVI